MHPCWTATSDANSPSASTPAEFPSKAPWYSAANRPSPPAWGASRASPSPTAWPPSPWSPNKHLTTDDDDLADTTRGLRNLCFQPGKRFVHERLGWNLRMTNLQAALGLAQLEQVDRNSGANARSGAATRRYSRISLAYNCPWPAPITRRISTGCTV